MKQQNNNSAGDDSYSNNSITVFVMLSGQLSGLKPKPSVFVWSLTESIWLQTFSHKRLSTNFVISFSVISTYEPHMNIY